MLETEDISVVDDILKCLVTNGQEASVVAESFLDQNGELVEYFKQLIDVLLAVLNRTDQTENMPITYTDNAFGIFSKSLQTFSANVMRHDV